MWQRIRRNACETWCVIGCTNLVLGCIDAVIHPPEMTLSAPQASMQISRMQCRTNRHKWCCCPQVMLLNDGLRGAWDAAAASRQLSGSAGAGGNSAGSSGRYERLVVEAVDCFIAVGRREGAHPVC